MPLVNTARYAVEAVKAPVASVAVVPVTAVHVGVAAVQFVDFCHAIVPVEPANVKVVPVLVVHNVFVPLIVPATDAGVTVTVVALEVALHVLAFVTVTV